jgi:hypothetical protein
MLPGAFAPMENAAAVVAGALAGGFAGRAGELGRVDGAVDLEPHDSGGPGASGVRRLTSRSHRKT